MAYVYLHKKLNTEEIFYVGISSNDDDNFLRSKSSARSKYWKNIVNKYGYEIIIHLTNLTLDEAYEKEIELIKYYGRLDLKTGTLVNMSDGGEGCNNPSEEHRKAISLGNKGKKLSQETKDKMSKAVTGRKATQETKDKMSLINKGKKLSEEHKAVFNNKGRKHKQETKDKMSKLHTGKKLSQETKDKLSKNHNPKSNTLGYKHTDETKENMKLLHKKRRDEKMKNKPIDWEIVKIQIKNKESSKNIADLFNITYRELYERCLIEQGIPWLEFKENELEIIIDWKIVESYLEQQSSGRSIANLLGIPYRKLYDKVMEEYGMTFEEFKESKSSIGIEKLRHKMYKTAMDGNTSVMQFLSKNLLGYSDKVEQKISLKEWKVSFDLDTDIEDTSDAD